MKGLSKGRYDETFAGEDDCLIGCAKVCKDGINVLVI